VGTSDPIPWVIGAILLAVFAGLRGKENPPSRFRRYPGLVVMPAPKAKISRAINLWRFVSNVERDGRQFSRACELGAYRSDLQWCQNWKTGVWITERAIP
jgi:hypothetical protein